MTNPILLNTREAAALRGTTQRQIQRLAKAGVLPVYRVAQRNSLLFKKSDVMRAPVSLAR
jgi:excisionase family DNA binding protein